MGFVLVYGAIIGLIIGVFKIKGDTKAGKTGKCRFCGAKMAGRYSIEMPVCQRCGRTQPWAVSQVEKAQSSDNLTAAGAGLSNSVRLCPTCQQPLTTTAGRMVHAYSMTVSCLDHARVMGLPAPFVE
jgi:hypothetical protein